MALFSQGIKVIDGYKKLVSTISLMRHELLTQASETIRAPTHIYVFQLSMCVSAQIGTFA